MAQFPSDTSKAGGDGSWFKTNELVRFEVRYSKGMSAHLIIGPGKPELRQELFDIASSSPTVFKGCSKALYSKWTQAWRSTIFRESGVEDETQDARFAKVQKWWAAFLKNELPVLTKAFGADPGRRNQS